MLMEFLCCKIHAPGLQGIPNDTRISWPDRLAPLRFAWADSASCHVLMSINANPRDTPLDDRATCKTTNSIATLQMYGELQYT